MALHLALELGISVWAPLEVLDNPAPALLVHLEATASVPFNPALAREAHSRPLPLGHQAAVPDQVAPLEYPASPREELLEPLGLDWVGPPETAELS